MTATDLVDVAIPYDQLVVNDDREPFKCQKLNPSGEKDEIDCQLYEGLSTDYFHVLFTPCNEPQYTVGGVCLGNTEFHFFIVSGIKNAAWILESYPLGSFVSTMTADLQHMIDSGVDEVII